MEYNNEKDFVDELEKRLNNLHYKTWREVVPDECKNWDMPFRVDLIFWHPIHKFVGVEAKNIRSLRQGSIFSKAIKQLLNYKNFNFLNGNKISKWCIAVPQSIDTLCGGCDKQNLLREINEFIRGFVKNMYNISMIDYNQHGIFIDSYTTEKIVIEETTNEEQPQIDYSEYNICPDCAFENDIEDKYCNRCDKSIENDI